MLCHGVRDNDSGYFNWGYYEPHTNNPRCAWRQQAYLIHCGGEYPPKTFRLPMKKRYIALLTLCGLAASTHLLAGSATPASEGAGTPTPTATPSAAASLDTDTIYSVLTAELAGQRNQLDISYDQYLLQAQKTKDASLAQRATYIALQMRDSARILKASQLWVTLDPTNAEPRTFLIQQLAKANRYGEIGPHIDAILKTTPDANMQDIVMGAEELSSAHLKELTSTLQTAANQYPKNDSLHLALAHLLMLDKKWSDAQAQINIVLTKNSLQEQAILMQADLLLAQKQTALAVEKIHDAINRGANSKRVELYYARLLIENKQLDAAKDQLKHVVELYPDDGELLFTVALLALDSNMTNFAKVYFQQLIAMGVHESEAHYYLGQISEDRNDATTAMDHYEKIDANADVYLAGVASTSLILLKQGKGTEAIEKVEQSRNLNPELGVDLYLIESDLLIKQSRYQDAVTLLTKALKENKNNAELMYARALAAEKTNNIALLESDLRYLIKENPEDVSALNALGYTLADKTNRTKEALDLINKAIALRPDDPAIIDSMGWVQYRLGDYAKATELLKSAYQKFPDDEIAAHLIEVLWVTGKKDEATQLYTAAIKKTPDSEILKSTMDRLKKSPK